MVSGGIGAQTGNRNERSASGETAKEVQQGHQQYKRVFGQQERRIGKQLET
jgi:hypothetical protein